MKLLFLGVRLLDLLFRQISDSHVGTFTSSEDFREGHQSRNHAEIVVSLTRYRLADSRISTGNDDLLALEFAYTPVLLQVWLAVLIPFLELGVFWCIPLAE